jgi:preprotein translocase subunit YajC
MLISPAWAQAAPAPGQGDFMTTMLMMGGMMLIIYFLFMRPQMKRAKEHKTMIDGLAKGDEVVTAGGVLGRISKLNENYVTVEIAERTEVQLQRSAIQLVLPKGTIKNI